MGRKQKELSVDVRNIIIKLHNQCKSYREISTTLGIPRSTVYSVVERYGKSKTVKNKVRSGRPSIVNDTTKRLIVRKVTENPRLSAPKIAEELERNLNLKVSASTARNILRSSGLHGRVPRKKFWVNKNNRLRRIKFAEQYQNKTQEFWNKVLFTDESKFNIFGPDGRGKIWRKKNSEMDKKNLAPLVKHGGGSVLVWGCMSAAGVGKLVFIDSIMDHEVYVGILKENLKESVIKLGMQDDYFFQQDNDPKHTALRTKLWLLYNTPNRLETPPQSPDLNPIENLWSLLDSQIRKRGIKNKNELKTALLEEWERFGPSTTSSLVKSMQNRLKFVLAAKGYPTKY